MTPHIITSIATKTDKIPPFMACYYRIGEPPCNAAGEPVEGPLVSEIKSCRDRFGTGALYDGPCYSVHFSEATEKVILGQEEVARVTVDEKVKTEEQFPAVSAE